MDLKKLAQKKDPWNVFLEKGIKAMYPDMTDSDVRVCVEVYTCWYDEHPRHYIEIVSRMEYRYEELVREGNLYFFNLTNEERDKEITASLYRAYKQGYIIYYIDFYGTDSREELYRSGQWKPDIFVKLREDIFDALESIRLADMTTWGHPNLDFNLEDLAAEIQGGGPVTAEAAESIKRVDEALEQLRLTHLRQEEKKKEEERQRGLSEENDRRFAS
jgi:hypothetical protein